jgi:hypothetical protein
MPSLPFDPVPDKNPRELASGILDFLTDRAKTDSNLRLVLQQGAAKGELICLAVEERLAARRKPINRTAHRILVAGVLRNDERSIRTLAAMTRREARR